MKIVLSTLVGLILGLVVGGMLTARIVKAKMEPRFTEDSHGCGKILPAYSVTVDGIAAPSASTNDHDKIGYGTKLGGEPDWIQGVDIPVCRMCKTPMLFVAQIDSIAMADKRKPVGKGSKTGKEMQEFMFGDAGMVYVFTCLDCGEVAGVGQCY
jgi:hypothetical protein